MQQNLETPVKIDPVYSLKSSYYSREFSSINQLINDVINSGMDPNCEITKNGVGIGESVMDYMQE